MFSLVSSIGTNTKYSEDSLDVKINKYSKLLTKIKALEYQIKSTNFISINNMKEIDIEIQKKNKEVEIERSYKKIHKVAKASGVSYGSYPLLTKIRSFRIENLYPEDLIMAQQYSFLNINKYEKLKALHIIKYNLEKKNQLKQIYQEYKSHDKIVDDLTDLYQQKITTII